MGHFLSVSIPHCSNYIVSTDDFWELVALLENGNSKSKKDWSMQWVKSADGCRSSRLVKLSRRVWGLPRRCLRA